MVEIVKIADNKGAIILILCTYICDWGLESVFFLFLVVGPGAPLILLHADTDSSRSRGPKLKTKMTNISFDTFRNYTFGKVKLGDNMPSRHFQAPEAPGVKGPAKSKNGRKCNNVWMKLACLRSRS